MTGESLGWGGVNEGRGRRFQRLPVLLAVAVAGLALAAPSAWALSPSVGSKAASNVDYSTATLNGTVNPNGLETKFFFEYGTTVSYGSKTAEVSAGSGSTSLEKAQAVSGLTPNMTYHYRVVASNADGTSSGGDRTFYVGWNTQTVASPGTAGHFEDVSCSAASECTAVGASGSEGLVQRWNGSEWKAQTTVKPAGATEVMFNGVSCPSSAACYAVGAYKNSSAQWVSLVEFWNGSEWKVQTSPNPAATGVILESVSCSSSTECTAVGWYWESGPPEVDKTLAMRWNGTEWKIQTTPNPISNSSPQLTSVSCPASAFCMATGYYYDSPTSAWAPLSERWEGGEWVIKTPQKPAGATMSWLFGVSCTSSTACTAVGDKEINATTHQHQTVAQRWNGSSWALQATPNPESTNLALEDVSCVSATECVGIGSFTNASLESPMGLRWNGSEWALRSPPTPAGTMARPFGISCIASRGCEAVGLFKNASSVIVPLAQASWRKAAPTATTTAATGVGNTTATLNATVNPNGSEAKGYFEYGTTTSYGSKTAEVNLGSGTGSVETNAPVTGLSPGTTYHYRIVANNENPETSKGGDLTLRTSGPPTVLTEPAEVDVATGEAATLKGQVNPNGLSTTYQFEYGTSPGVYTNTVPAVAESAGSGTESKLVSYKVTGLSRSKTYYFRITASNSAGKSNGGELSFTTPNVPGATTESAVEVTRKCATLRGTVQPNLLTTKYWFEYGPTTSYGTKIPLTPKEVSAGTSSKAVEETACGLASKSLYHFRLVAENGLGLTNGADKTVTTLGVVTLAIKGIPLKMGAALKVFSSNPQITVKETTLKHVCTEAEFSGSVAENPGAVENVTAPLLQNAGGAACSYYPLLGLTVKYSFPVGGMTMEYTLDEAGQGLAKLSTFVLLGKIYSGASLFAECEYSVKMSGSYKFNVPLELALSGESQLVKGPLGGICYPTEIITGTFSVTSGGEAVEAKP